MNIKIILRVVGLLMFVEGAFLLLPLIISLIYGENDSMGFVLSSGTNMLVGGAIIWFTRNASKDIGKREGFIIVSLVWIVFSLLGSLPYIFTGAIQAMHRRRCFTGNDYSDN